MRIELELNQEEIAHIESYIRTRDIVITRGLDNSRPIDKLMKRIYDQIKTSGEPIVEKVKVRPKKEQRG